jgi:hypothetical protein
MDNARNEVRNEEGCGAIHPGCRDTASCWVRIDPFRQGLRELGYVEGKNIIVEWRSDEGKRDRQRSAQSPLPSTSSPASRRI